MTETSPILVSGAFMTCVISPADTTH